MTRRPAKRQGMADLPEASGGRDRLDLNDEVGRHEAGDGDQGLTPERQRGALRWNPAHCGRVGAAAAVKTP